MPDPINATPFFTGTLPGKPGPTLAQTTLAGGIQGGLLRPGAIDQEAFKIELAKAAQTETKQPAINPGSGAVDLSPAQFQSLLSASGQTGSQVLPPGAVDGAASPAAAIEPTVPSEPDAASATDEIRDEGVTYLHRRPDRDEADMLRGKTWRVVEDPRARTLFLGEDGSFGLDDFIDLINPLQHFPIVNLVYRQLTGDQIAGAPQMMGAMVFGPFSVMATIADLAVKSTTGAGIADNAVAMVFGPSEPASIDTPEQLAMSSAGAMSDRGSRRS